MVAKKQQNGFTPAPECSKKDKCKALCGPAKKHSVQGFTLPELLVAMAVFVILATVVLTNFHFGTAGDDLRQSADELVANLRRIQNMAQAGELVHFDGSTKNPVQQSKDVVPLGGYGLQLDLLAKSDGRLHYYLYADFGGCSDNTFGCNASVACTFYTKSDQTGFSYEPLCDEAIEGKDVAMRPNIVFSSYSFTGPPYTPPPGISAFTVRVNFQSPQPVPYVDGLLGRGFSIELQNEKTTQCRLVTVDSSSGFISEAIESVCKNPF